MIFPIHPVVILLKTSWLSQYRICRDRLFSFTQVLDMTGCAFVPTMPPLLSPTRRKFRPWAPWHSGLTSSQAINALVLALFALADALAHTWQELVITIYLELRGGASGKQPVEFVVVLCRKCQMLTPSCSAPWLASLLLCQNMSYLIVVTPREIAGLSALTSSTVQGGGGSFKNRKPIGEIGCCESGMAERIHWWTERCLRSPLFLSLALTIYLPTCLSSMYLSIYLSIDRSIYLSIYLSISLFPSFISLPTWMGKALISTWHTCKYIADL